MDRLHYQKTAYVPPHQVFSQFVQQVNILCLSVLVRWETSVCMGNLMLGTVQKSGSCVFNVYSTHVYMCDTYLKQLWQTAIQWLQLYETKKVYSGH